MGNDALTNWFVLFMGAEACGVATPSPNLLCLPYSPFSWAISAMWIINAFEPIQLRLSIYFPLMFAKRKVVERRTAVKCQWPESRETTIKAFNVCLQRLALRRFPMEQAVWSASHQTMLSVFAHVLAEHVSLEKFEAAWQRYMNRSSNVVISRHPLLFQPIENYIVKREKVRNLEPLKGRVKYCSATACEENEWS